MSIANAPDQITPLQKGAKAPNTRITRTDDIRIGLTDMLNDQAAVLIFYRGSW